MVAVGGEKPTRQESLVQRVQSSWQGVYDVWEREVGMVMQSAFTIQHQRPIFFPRSELRHDREQLFAQPIVRQRRRFVRG